MLQLPILPASQVDITCHPASTQVAPPLATQPPHCLPPGLLAVVFPGGCTSPLSL